MPAAALTGGEGGTTDAPPGAGCHGKVPALGDFVTRGLPRSVIDPWHAWLEEGVAASQEALGDGWLAAFLTCPVWRFALPAGLCGPWTVAGVLIPSVDKVGRYFPFTLLKPLAGPWPPLALAVAATGWYGAAEQLALTALDRSAGTTRVEAGLAQLPELGGPPADAGLCLPQADPLLGRATGGRLLAGAPELLGFACAADVSLRLDGVLGSHALWWTDGSDRVPAGVLASAGLPKPGAFTALLDGDWSRWDGSRDANGGWGRE